MPGDQLKTIVKTILSFFGIYEDWLFEGADVGKLQYLQSLASTSLVRLQSLVRVWKEYSSRFVEKVSRLV